MDQLLGLLSGSDKFKSLILSWFVPTLLFVILFALAIGPELRGSWLAVQFATATGRLALNRGLAALILSALVASVGYLMRDDVYRVLEGYSWPRAVAEWRKGRVQVPEARYVRALQQYRRAKSTPGRNGFKLKLDAADEFRHNRGRGKVPGADETGEDQGRGGRKPFRRRRPLFVPRDRGRECDGEEDLPRYVDDDAYVAPTTFGNRMAVAESYGYEAYGLDSQKFWFDLVDVTGTNTLKSISDARDKLDALVAILLLSYVFLVGAAGALVWAALHHRNIVPIAVAGALAWLAGIVSYRLSLRAVDDYGDSFQTMVNHGRLAMTKKHGLRLPPTIADERKMWEALAGTVYYPGSTYYEAMLAPFRNHGSGGRAAAATTAHEPAAEKQQPSDDPGE